MYLQKYGIGISDFLLKLKNTVFYHLEATMLRMSVSIITF